MKISEAYGKVIIDGFEFYGQLEENKFCSQCKSNLVYYDKLALRQNLFLLKKEYKKTSVSAKVESTTKQQSEVYRCIPILSRFYSIYQS